MFRSAGATNGRPLIARNAGNRLIWGIGSMIKQILFNTDMVRAILDGRKTVTRRVAKPQPKKEVDKIALERFHKPYRPGDILYVRETWTQDGDVFRYKAGFYDQNRRWHPSIHMPREAARIFLRVTDVRVERLQGITESEAEKEGLRYFDDICQDRDWHPSFYDPDSGGNPSTVAGFSRLWDCTIKKADRALYGWEANPWVWVIEFERISREEAEHD